MTHRNLASAATVATEGDSDGAALAQAIEVIVARQYRQGERVLAQYSSRFQPLYPDHDYLQRRGVDLVAFAKALGSGLDPVRFGQVIQFKNWCVDEFNLFNRAGVSTSMMNDAMQRFLEDPRHW